ncbi:unnamed protein product [Cylindrotheca closterium]|uniref:EGF-like domain-containing protein n=1 Tax=Cylindrotheca closterium TaxID=2856 RepID=A0AAD2G638_9STRA|nr:unnamed protein product [Cylindrotheca closterium]
MRCKSSRAPTVLFEIMIRFLYLALLCLVTIKAQQQQQRPPSPEKCDSLACANRGECYAFYDRNDAIVDTQCICPFNFTGPLCEIPALCDTTCLNGGSCQFGESWWLSDESFLREVLERCTFSGQSVENCTVLEQRSQYCQCPPDVFGNNCEIACDLQCQNDGTCEIWRGNQPRCNCDYPYFGDLCEETCSLECQNGGRCLAYDTNNDTIKEQMCLCPSNSTGAFCETEKPCSKECTNGGRCQQEQNWWLEEAEFFDDIFDRIYEDCSYNQNGTFGGLSDCMELYAREYCECPPDTFGEFCQVTCDIQCQNGGACQVLGNEAQCRCQQGFFGELCEEACDLSCSNGGRCVAYDSNNDTIKEKHCLCPSKFTGDLCTEPRECQNECFNGGRCIMEDAWFLNDMDFIEEILDELSSECLRENIFMDQSSRERCMGLTGREYCQCPPNVWGSQCETACDLDCSGTNGNCTFTRYTGSSSDKNCRCRPGFSGERCQFECNTRCENNGRCVADGTSEYCQCTPFWEGNRCQTEKSCSKSCANGGTCIFADGNRYNDEYLAWCLDENNGNCHSLEQCDCPPGWVGADCSSPCPCQNGGTCSRWRRELQRDLQGSNWTDGDPEWPPDYNFDEDGNQDSYCSCPFGFYGNQCQFQYGDSDCSLQCLNNGYCERNFIFGNSTNPDGSNNPNHDDDDNDMVNGSDRISVERCICPGNFTGPTCGEVLDECYNMCQNGGVCSSPTTSTQRFGGRALQSYLTPEEEGHDFGPGRFGAFCQCDDGYSGEYCERKACGSGFCANGAACIELPAGQTTYAGDDYVCDCTVASLGAGFDDTIYIGRQCESAVHHECFNDATNPNENWQCANDGRCFYGSSGPQCRCDWNWQGPRCEVNSTDTKDIAWSQCNLACQNGGSCLKGVVKPIASMFTRFLEPTKKSELFDFAPSANFEYCYCPSGFFGVECEMQYELCGNGEHICFHGSTCEQTGGEWTCDCMGTESAGLYCQYQATDDCGDSEQDTFCTNGSTCGADKKCSCLDGWEGDKCEVEIKTAAIQGGDDKWSDANLTRSSLAILLWTIASIALAVM